MLAPIFGMRLAARFEELLTEHLLIAADLVNAAKNGEADKANFAREKWYRNADEIAVFLHCINRCWDEEKWRCMLYSHLEMTEKEATLRLQGNYAADINIFDDIENEAFQMADYMFCGIIKMCSR
ncbi:MAG: acetylglutamate kinase [Oscillospiraceae bacterium]|nr:acetylglutamate kinase [Oscillospiraceae bacterium]